MNLKGIEKKIIYNLLLVKKINSKLLPCVRREK